MHQYNFTEKRDTTCTSDRLYDLRCRLVIRVVHFLRLFRHPDLFQHVEREVIHHGVLDDPDPMILLRHEDESVARLYVEHGPDFVGYHDLAFYAYFDAAKKMFFVVVSEVLFMIHFVSPILTLLPD